MKNEKANQRDRLIYELAILLQPLEELARDAVAPSPAMYRVAMAKVQAGDNSWRKTAQDFTTFAHDVVFNPEFQDISHVPERLRSVLTSQVNDPAVQDHPDELQRELQRLLSEALAGFRAYIARVPVGWEPVIFEANTPFTSYLRIKECLTVVERRLHYFDRYLKLDFFRLFLESVDTAVSVRLVTTSAGVKAVSAVSNLARQQWSDYQLIEVASSDMHDRNLRVDDQVFSLGTGVDCAGMALTNFGPADSSVEAHAELDLVIARGRVVHQT